MNRKEASEILNISVHSNLQAIKSAYRKLAMKYHPDQNQDPHAKSRFIAIHEAYSYLTDLANGKIKETPPSTSNRNSHQKSHGPNWNRDAYQQRDYSQHADYDKRYEQARRRAEQEFDKKSDAIYVSVLNSYQKSWKRTFVKYFAPIAAIFGLLLIIDFFLPSISEYRTDSYVVEFYDLNTKYYYYHFGSTEIQIDRNTYRKLLDQYIEAEICYKPILRDLTSVKVTSSNGFNLTLSPRLNSHSFFPFLHLLFFAPLIGLFFERPKFWYVFFVIYSNIYIIPIIFTLLIYRTITL